MPPGNGAQTDLFDANMSKAIVDSRLVRIDGDAFAETQQAGRLCDSMESKGKLQY